ncbi:LAFA_0G20252g1_1 [Lachancea sp. 'fantastica']|nr:LAFA_0G20252g1_1 [Lachancea sp. 'fantastica']
MSDIGSSDIGSRSRTTSIDSQMYAIPAPESPISTGSSSSDDGEEEAEEEEWGNGEENDNEQVGRDWLARPLEAPVFDVSRYIFQSLAHALNSADFAQAIAIQTRTAGIINSRSRELEQLVDTLQQRLPHLETRFARGSQVARQIRRRLEFCSGRVKQVEKVFEKRYAIEYQQAKDEVERVLDEEH